MKGFQPEKLAKARAKKGWTQQQLADAAGIPQSNIGRLESGVVQSPRWGTLERLAVALGIDVEDLYAEPQPGTPQVDPIWAQLYLKHKGGIATKKEEEQLYRLALQAMSSGGGGILPVVIVGDGFTEQRSGLEKGELPVAGLPNGLIPEGEIARLLDGLGLSRAS